MGPIHWLFIALLSVLPIGIAIRWAIIRKRRAKPTSYPAIINEWTGVVETEAKPRQNIRVIADEAPAPAQPLGKDTDVLGHYAAMFASAGEILEEADRPVPIAIYPPTRKRGWWTYATAGLHQAGGTELLLYSYNRDEAMIAHLYDAAAKVRKDYEEAGGKPDVGDYFLLDGPIVKGSRLDHMVVAPLSFEEEGYAYFFNGDKMIAFLALLPITRREAHFLQKHGWDALVARFVAREVNALDLERSCAVEEELESHV